MSWIWAGGVVLLFGALLALWPAPEAASRRVSAAVPEGAVGATS